MGPKTQEARPPLPGTPMPPIDPIFAITGPSAGVLHVNTADLLPDQRNKLDDNISRAISDCLKSVVVPLDRYWRAASQHHTLLCSTSEDGAVDSSNTEGATPSHWPAAERIPDPENIPYTFYSTRMEAIIRRSYQKDRGEVLIAADVRSGNSGKIFNTLRRREIASFVNAIPLVPQRNLYVMIDKDAAVDPFFDIDCSPPFEWLNFPTEVAEGENLPSNGSRAKDSSSQPPVHIDTAVVERCLLQILQYLRDVVEEYAGAKLEHCLVLTGSVLVSESSVGPSAHTGATRRHNLLSSKDTKLSFHVHFRLEKNVVFSNIRELHKFMMKIRGGIDDSFNKAGDRETRSFYHMLQCCIDFGVYSRWRAFRLPYNVKASSDGLNTMNAASFNSAIDAATKSPFRTALIPNLSVGEASHSIVHEIDLSTLQDSLLYFEPTKKQQEHHALLTKLFGVFRFLLPVVPKVTAIGNAELAKFLLAHQPPFPPTEESVNPSYRDDLARVVFELALIQRDASNLMNEGDDKNTFNFIMWSDSAEDERDNALIQGPFGINRPPLRDGARAPVRDSRIKKLIAEVFHCLSPAFGGGLKSNLQAQSSDILRQSGSYITADSLSVDYQDGVRFYYVRQKSSKFCIRLGREHRSTYPQLYLTYGSIKIRCYSNDCSGKCHCLKWSPNDNERICGSSAVLLSVDDNGYPKYDRLAEIRDLLFPPLSQEELIRRYGITSVASGDEDIVQQW
ncbi:PrimPol-like protein 2 [Trypanosoma equiperdum]|uniref:PrimPol-like protein 2 n=1 Tax=Trypanosoma equiperdum TaxID=5694 RepID=A0A1G4I203_TRYEQ|nr:PrimPol-like protein 2 [Trypanosoma equiperdum]